MITKFVHPSLTTAAMNNNDIDTISTVKLRANTSDFKLNSGIQIHILIDFHKNER